MTAILTKAFASPDAASLGLPPCGPDEVWHYFTTADVDRSREVLVPSGGDYREFLLNPVVTWNHSDEDAGSYLLPVGRSEELRVLPNGVVSRTKFDMKNEFAAQVGGQVRRGFLNAYSIRFLPLDFGPPTFEETRLHPEWAKAKTIYRKWRLISFSPVLTPDNPYAVSIQKRLDMGTQSKGMEPFKSYPADESAWDDSKARKQFKDFAESDDAIDWGKFGLGFAYKADPADTEGAFKFPHHYVVDGKITTCKAGVIAAIAACHGARSGGAPEGADEALKHLLRHAKELGLPSAEPESKAMKPEQETEDDEEMDSAAGLKKGMHVKCAKSQGGGCGVIKSMHRKGMHDEVEASEGEPVAKVMMHDKECKATDTIKAMHCKYLRPHEDEEADGKEAEAKGMEAPTDDEEMEETKRKSLALAAPMTEQVGATGGMAVEPEAKAEPETPDEAAPTEEEMKKPKVGHFVKFDTGKYKGVGKVLSLHRGELVPHVQDDVLGEDDDPGVAVKVYKPMGDGHVESSHTIGCKFSECEKCLALKAPTKAKGAAGPARDLSAAAPVLKIKTLTEAETKARLAAFLASPEGQAAVAKRLPEVIKAMESKRRGAI